VHGDVVGEFVGVVYAAVFFAFDARREIVMDFVDDDESAFGKV